VDKLTIETPEQVQLEYALAGIGSRFMAVLLDTFIQLVLWVIVLIFSIAVSFNPFSSNSGVWAIAIFSFLSFVVYTGYFAILEAFWKGQTVGKRWAGIRVIKDSGRPITPFEAIARNLIRIVDYMPAFYGVGVVTMMLNTKNRRLGDFVAGTIVVHETSDRESAIFFNTPAVAEHAFPSAAQLTIEEAELIEAFLARRLDIPPAIRQQNAARIAQTLATRLDIAPDERPADHENFLELLVKEFRNRARYR
jgi:uncharacterized RDD family membrane protein YckC